MDSQIVHEMQKKRNVTLDSKEEKVIFDPFIWVREKICFFRSDNSH